MKKSFVSLLSLLTLWNLSLQAQSADSLQNIVDEVVWVVGDEAILKSDIEVTRIQAGDAHPGSHGGYALEW